MLRGSAWTVIGFGGSQVIRLAGNLVLTRLLFPEAFGQMALVSLFLSGLELFSDIGIGPSIIQHAKGDDPRFLGTAWAIQIVRGIALTACAMALAWPASTLWFEKPEIAPYMMAAGVTPLIAGLNSTKLFTANRHLMVGRVMALDLAIQATNLTTTVALAAAYRSVWALVAGGLLGATLKMAMSHIALPGLPDRPRWDRESARDLMRFGRWIFLATAMSFLANQGDRLMLGRIFDGTTLGIYSVAFLLSDAPVRLVSTLSQKVIFPAVSRIHREDRGRVPQVYGQARRWLDLLALPPVGLLIVLAPRIVSLLFDPRYAAAGPMLSILAIRVAIGCSLSPLSHTLIAMGRPQYSTFATGVRAAWLFAGIPLAWKWFDIPGAVWVVGLSDFPALVVMWWGAASHGLLSVRNESRAVLLVLAGAGIGLLLHLALSLV